MATRKRTILPAPSITVVVVVCLYLMMSVGCVSLDKQTKSTKAEMVKSPKSMQKFTEFKGSKLTTKVKRAIPLLNRPRQTVKAPPPAKNDPTRLDNMPSEISPEMHLSIARVAEQQGRPATARKHYNQVLQMERGNRNALIGLARLYHRGGDTNTAIRIYRDALTVHRNDPVIMNDLGLCYARNGQLNEAISILQMAIRLAPDREMYVDNLAAALVEANRNQEALAYLSRIHSPDVANLRVGYMLMQANRQDLAAEYLNTALAINPKMVEASDLLEQGNVVHVSARQPNRAGVVKPVNPLSNPQSYHPTGGSMPSTPGNVPSYFDTNEPGRVGPFGFVPPKEIEQIRVVSYVESD